MEWGIKLKRNLWMIKWLKLDQRDVFSRTQMRLTIYYSAILSLFLIVFVAIVLFILFRVIISEEERKLNEIADVGMREHQQSYSKQRDNRFRDENRSLFLSENQLFYYVTNPNGELLTSIESIRPMRPLFLDLITDWNISKNEIKQVRVAVPTDLPEYRQFRDLEMRVLMLGRPIISNGEFLGMMYIGLDITYFDTIFKWVLIVCLSIALLFIGVAIWLSNIMSRKALVPVETAYNQQREFVANASHELRTPLSVIFSSLEALELEEKERDAFSQKMMRGMKDEVKRMTKLINDLLTLARLDSEEEKNGIVKEWFDFYPNQVLESFINLATEKGITLSLHATEPLRIYADKDKLIQLLYILLDNALKYTSSGGTVTVHIQSSKQKDLIITVKDTGIGISEEDQMRIYDRFFRVNKARTRKEGGYGLGLSIAKRIVDAHHGRIKIKSELGMGTEFEVTIPLK